MYIFLTTMMVLAFLLLAGAGVVLAVAIETSGWRDRWGWLFLGVWLLLLGFAAGKYAMGV